MSQPPSETQMFHRQLTIAAQRLHYPKIRVHVIQDSTLNSFAIGTSQPFSMVLHSATVETLELDELPFVIGHEAGRIKAGRTF